MAATAEMLADLRRKIAEPTQATYSDAALTALVEARPLTDANGVEPYIESYVYVGVITRLPNTAWMPTYDLNAVAGAIWAEKATALAGNFDFSADGASYSRSQGYEQFMKLSRYYLARRAVRSITQQSDLAPDDQFGDDW